MEYRHDNDLEFLSQICSEDLEDLVYCITHDKDGNSRLTEELTLSDRYKQHNPDHQKYWDLIAAEIQCFGANTFATLARGGKGVEYKEILIDVCDKMKVNYNKDSSTEKIENNLLMKILTDALEKMSPEELKSLVETIGIKNTNNITPEAMVAAFQTIFRLGGFKSYQLTFIIVNAILKALIGRGLPFAAGPVIAQTLKILTGPIGWAITGIWTAIDIASPAYRVTIPAVILVSALRQKHLYGNLSNEVSFD
jgi:uncharacterized protein YaaW (UPF0174 family)